MLYLRGLSQQRYGLKWLKASIREIEKPNVSGWFANKCLRIVDLPDPEGPEITIGRCVLVAVDGGLISCDRSSCIYSKVPARAIV